MLAQVVALLQVFAGSLQAQPAKPVFDGHLNVPEQVPQQQKTSAPSGPCEPEQVLKLLESQVAWQLPFDEQSTTTTLDVAVTVAVPAV